MATMADTNEGTPEGTGEAQTQEGTPATGTPQTPDEVTTLRSRNAGLDAKVTELSKATKVAQEAAAAAAQKLADYESGKVQGDEALRAQFQAKEAELALVKREAALSRIEVKYPETFGVLGEAAAALTEDQLAASEARMSGAGLSETPTPLGSNPPRNLAAANKSIEDMNTAELRRHLATFPRAMWGGSTD